MNAEYRDIWYSASGAGSGNPKSLSRTDDGDCATARSLVPSQRNRLQSGPLTSSGTTAQSSQTFPRKRRAPMEPADQQRDDMLHATAVQAPRSGRNGAR
jgi:hypothetical protein